MPAVKDDPEVPVPAPANNPLTLDAAEPIKSLHDVKSPKSLAFPDDCI